MTEKGLLYMGMGVSGGEEAGPRPRRAPSHPPHVKRGVSTKHQPTRLGHFSKELRVIREA